MSEIAQNVSSKSWKGKLGPLDDERSIAMYLKKYKNQPTFKGAFKKVYLYLLYSVD